MQPDLFAAPRHEAPPAPRQPAPYAHRGDRGRAFHAWQQAGSPWPPPAGLLSAILGALLRPRPAVRR
jgi:hypothetical protein